MLCWHKIGVRSLPQTPSLEKFKFYQIQAIETSSAASVGPKRLWCSQLRKALEEYPMQHNVQPKRSLDRASRYRNDDWISISTFGSQTPYKVLCANVSSSGIMFLGRSRFLPFQIKSLVEATFIEPTTQKVVLATGKVVRIDIPKRMQANPNLSEYGVKLIFLETRELEAWQNFVTKEK